MPRSSDKKAKNPSKRQVQDDYLDTDSEIDEFAMDGNATAGPSGSSDEDEDDAAEADEGEEEGVGQWVPDDWEDGDLGGSESDADGADTGSEDGSEEEQGDERVSSWDCRSSELQRS